MPSIFFSYSHADEAMRDQLEKHLSLLKRQGVIDTWHDRRIDAGEELHSRISDHVENDDIILLLISSDFLDSEYCYDVEMSRAMERHASGEAVVIPVILRSCSWKRAPFGQLMATPKNGLAISKWPDQDDAFLDVTEAIAKVVETRYGGNAQRQKENAQSSQGAVVEGRMDVSGSMARSSNLRVAKHFTDRDRDAFREDTFEFMANFFEGSLAELARRNPDIESSFRRIDANRFSAVAYRDGREVGRCTIYMGGMRDGIAYSMDGSSDGSFNECLSVKTDDQQIYLEGIGMGMSLLDSASHRESKLSQEGAAELYWEIFIQPLQRR